MTLDWIGLNFSAWPQGGSGRKTKYEEEYNETKTTYYSAQHELYSVQQDVFAVCLFVRAATNKATTKQQQQKRRFSETESIINEM